MLRNTRMPVATIFENLEAGANIDDILAWYDGLDRDQGQRFNHALPGSWPPSWRQAGSFTLVEFPAG